MSEKINGPLTVTLKMKVNGDNTVTVTNLTLTSENDNNNSNVAKIMEKVKEKTISGYTSAENTDNSDTHVIDIDNVNNENDTQPQIYYNNIKTQLGTPLKKDDNNQNIGGKRRKTSKRSSGGKRKTSKYQKRKYGKQRK